MAAAGRATGKPARARRTAGDTPAPVRLYDAPFAARLRTARRTTASALAHRDTLIDIVRAVHTTLEPSLIAGAVVERAARWIPLTCWSVVGADLQERLTSLADIGIAPELGSSIFGVADWVLRHDQPLFSGNIQHDPRIDSSEALASMALPLRGRERVIGALVGLDRGVSSAAPEPGARLSAALESILAPAGFALDTSLLLRRTEALSVTDDLTRLYNARYLNVALRRESRLAVRNSRPLSLLFIDLDGFKSINDSHGHLAGSRALVEAGAVIRGSARETDIVARFGGDEFALILPDTGAPGALAVAERIRERIARFRFLADDGLDIHLTASVGVATLPDVAVAADELVQAADAAMYRVKDRGKNGIQAAAPSR
jgi:diguanylate cyclase (GGDEF)-like protein